MPCEIREVAPGEFEQWDRFVLEHPYGTPFHLIAWRKTLGESFPSYRPLYLGAFAGRRLEAVLPLFLVRNPLIGKVLISTPFAVYGGVLALSAEAREATRVHVERLGQSLGVDYVELRNRYPEQRLGFAELTRYVTFIQEIGKDEAAILEAIPRKTRYMVRKALKHPYTTEITTTRLENFEHLYAASLRRLGTPFFPHRHFTALLRNYQGSIDIREAKLEGKAVAAVMTFYFRDQVLPYYGASDPAFNEFAPNNYMYFDLLRWGRANGYRIYDFGRSKKISGSFDFKAHWGMEMLDLPYEILLVRRKALPDYSPNNPRLQWAIRMWQHVPLPVTRWLGPWLLRLVP